jgi:hypothetical protein
LCPAARALGTAQLDDWRFLVSVDGYASIAPTPGACVHGVLWQLGPRDLAALDAYEAVDTGLYRRQALPVQAGERQVSAQVYVGRSAVPGRPRPGHLEQVIAAAKSWNLPATYCDEVRQWSGSGLHGAWTGAVT